jgi:2'-5' RNA ligase
MRAFLAIELPESVRTAVAAYQRQLVDSRADVKWVERDNLHITVRFLGEIDQATQRDVEALVRRVTVQAAPSDIVLSEIGAFPSMRAPRVIWIGAGSGHESLARVAQQIETGLEGLGFPPERRGFVVHATLGRVRSARGLTDLVRRLNERSWEPRAMRVEMVTLFQSQLSGAGSIYTPLARFPLGG